MFGRVIQGAFLGKHAVERPQAKGSNRFTVDPGVLRVNGPGSPLPEGVRGEMERALGADFTDVRIHVGPQAQSIGAIAFTVGSNLYFAPGRYQPDTVEGRRLLGHELAHVVQQKQGRVRGTAGTVSVVQDAMLEAEADRAGDHAARGFGRGAPGPRFTAQAAVSPVIQQARQRGTGNQPDKYRSRDIIMDRRARRSAEEQARRQAFKDLDNYVRTVIGPWATQARISQMIADDFDALGKSKTVTEKASLFNFGKTVTASSRPEIGHSHFGYVAPSRIKPRGRQGGGEFNRVIYRGYVEHEFFGGDKGGGSPAVRMYVTVASEAKVEKDGTTKYKDIQQVNGAIKIYTGTQANPILWVNAGQPLRACKWFDKYKVQDPNYKPLIRSFLVPAKVFQELSKGAGLEAEAGQRRNKGRSFNVDRHYATDQFGVRGSDLQKLMTAAIPNSLITYTDNPSHVTAKTAGRIESVNSLRSRLGVPEQTIPGVWVDPDKGDFADKKVFNKKADALMNIYAVWTGQDAFLSSKMAAIPRVRQRTLMRDELAALGKFIALEFWERIQRGEVPAAIAQRL